MTDGESVPPDFSALTDQSLVRRLRGGDDDAATALYYRYATRLMHLADRQVYEDIALQADREGIVQSIFRTFFRRASAGQYDVVSGDDLWKLMLTIALNKIRTAGTHHRAAKRNATKTHSLLPGQDAAHATRSDEETACLLLRMTIDELVGRLPEDQQQIVLLRIDGFEIEEISQKTGRAKRSVERILQQFRQRLEAVRNSPDE